MQTVNGRCYQGHTFESRAIHHSLRNLSRHAAHANSSPLSVNVPIAPDRLTLPPEQQRPGFHERQHHSDDGPRSNEGNRPGSRRFIECATSTAGLLREICFLIDPLFEDVTHITPQQVAKEEMSCPQIYRMPSWTLFVDHKTATFNPLFRIVRIYPPEMTQERPPTTTDPLICHIRTVNTIDLPATLLPECHHRHYL